jgi:hypothetical protein
VEVALATHVVSRTSESSTSESASPLETLTAKDARLEIDAAAYSAFYNSTPFGFEHNLNTLDLFQFDEICKLADRYTEAPPNDYFVTGTSPKADAAFFDTEQIVLKPSEAIRRLDEKPTRILLKRPENYDARFRTLMNGLLHQLRALPGGLGDQPIRRIQSSIFITSAAATTALHFDPEVAFFTQIEGDKDYHAYPPDQVTEPELEAFYSRGRVSIGQLDMAKLDPEQDHFFSLKAGTGFHQPQNAPHWVQTRAVRSISYSLVYETALDKQIGLTRAFNHFERMAGLNPAPPTKNPQLDGLKARAIVPVRFGLKVAHKLRHG